MAAWSNFASKNLKNIEFARRILSCFKNGAKGKEINYVPVRESHDRTIAIRSSLYFNYKLKDITYLYLAVGMIPLGLIIFYSNVFIGPAKLAVIPEGYHPQHWEYYQHPISRFFAKYIVPSRQEVYERNCHHIFKKMEKKQIQALEYKIDRLIRERNDYQAWYYDKPTTKYVRKAHRDAAKEAEEKDRIAGWVKQ